jgi:chemotaxis protein methyltransferase CheR
MSESFQPDSAVAASLSAQGAIAPFPSRPPLFTAEELEQFKQRVSPKIGFNLDAYKQRQMERRITALMCRANVNTLDEFFALLETDPQRLKDFVDGLMINVTEFYRNPEKFEELRDRVLPTLLSRFERLKIWSAGCSMGAELFTVGILLEQMGALDRCELIGTDLDREILKKAQQGLYTHHEVQSIPPEVMAHYFVQEGSYYRFTGEAVMARSEFRFQNLLQDTPESECQLILCRNVVIYLNDQSKRHLYQQFERALVPGGMLFVGNTERIFDCQQLGLELVSPYFYTKVAV